MKLKKIIGAAGIAAAIGSTSVMAGLYSVPVIAQPANPQDAIPFYEPADEKNVAITKSLAVSDQVAAGDIPALTYTFDFKSDATTQADIGTVEQYNAATGAYDMVETKIGPAFSSVSTDINPVEAETYEVNPHAGLSIDNPTLTAAEKTNGTPTQLKSESGTNYYRHETPNFLPAADANGNECGFTEAGVYGYLVTENVTPTGDWVNDATLNGQDWEIKVPTGQAGWEETLTMSSKTYRMLIYTAKDTNGKVYIWAMTIVEVNSEDPTETIGEKVTITSGGNTNISGDLSHFEYQNDYKRTYNNGGDPTLAPYAIQKKIEGLGADTTDIPAGKTWSSVMADDEFTFKVKLTRNAANSGDAAYVGKVWSSPNGADSWDPVLADATDPNSQISYTFTFNDEGVAEINDVKLKHYERLIFQDMPTGTTIDIEETDYTSDTGVLSPEGLNYDPSVSGAVETAGEGNKAHFVLTDDPGNVTKYVNDHGNGTTPTGVLMNNLPFFIIIGGGVAALIAGVVVKGRRRSNNTVQ